MHMINPAAWPLDWPRVAKRGIPMSELGGLAEPVLLTTVVAIIALLAGMFLVAYLRYARRDNLPDSRAGADRDRVT